MSRSGNGRCEVASRSEGGEKYICLWRTPMGGMGGVGGHGLCEATQDLQHTESTYRFVNMSHWWNRDARMVADEQGAGFGG